MQNRHQQIDLREYRLLLARADSQNLVSPIQIDKREILREALDDYSRADEELEAASNRFRTAKENQLKKTIPFWKLAVAFLALYSPLIGILFVGLLASGPVVPILIAALGAIFIGAHFYSTYRLDKIDKENKALTQTTEQCEQVFNKNQADKETAGKALAVAASKLKEALDSVEKVPELAKDNPSPFTDPFATYINLPEAQTVTLANRETLFASTATGTSSSLHSPTLKEVKPFEPPTTWVKFKL